MSRRTGWMAGRQILIMATDGSTAMRMAAVVMVSVGGKREKRELGCVGWGKLLEEMDG